MRLAVFTNKFPSVPCTFLARDIRVLLDAGIHVDVFSLYPLDASLWAYVPDVLSEDVFPRSRVHHLPIAKSLLPTRRMSLGRATLCIKDVSSILTSATRFGFKPLVKSAYASLEGWGLAHHTQQEYDHVLAYWGNYAATSAYLFHRLSQPQAAFSMFLRAGTDLYRDQVFLKQKVFYADNVFVLCDFNRRFLQELYPESFREISDKIRYYFTGLDLAEFPYRPDSRPERKIVAVGGLTRLKGFDYLLHAVHELGSRGTEVEVDFAGDGQEGASLRALSHQLGIADRVRFLGWLPFEEVKSAMLKSTLLVHPSSDIGDAVPNVIKEAMALGTPVVASSVAGIPELLDQGRCGELVPPRDPRALANAIEKLLQNESLRRQYAEAGRRSAEEKLDLWKNGQQLASILRSTRRSQK